MPRKPDARTRIASPDELTRLLANAKPGLRCLILLCFQTAMRFSEALSICPANYDQQNHTVTFTGKGGVTNQLPVTEEIAALFASAAPASATDSFVLALSETATATSTLQNQWKALKKKAGVDPSLRIHDLRRTQATAVYRSTKDMRLVQQLLSHRRMESTFHYLAPHDPKNLKPILEAIQPATKVIQ